MVAEVFGDAVGARQQITMRQHHALGFAGAARGVENSGHVQINDPRRRWTVRRVQQRRPVEDTPVAQRWGRGRGGVGQHQGMQIGTIGQRWLQQGRPVAGRNQNPHVAVAQNVGDLFGLQQRIDRDEHAASQRRAKQRDYGFQPLRQIDGDPFRPVQAQGPQPASHGLDLPGQGGIVQRGLPVGKGGGGGTTIRLFEDEFVQQSGHAGFGDDGGWEKG